MGAALGKSRGQATASLEEVKERRRRAVSLNTYSHKALQKHTLLSLDWKTICQKTTLFPLSEEIVPFLLSLSFIFSVEGFPKSMFKP